MSYYQNYLLIKVTELVVRKRLNKLTLWWRNNNDVNSAKNNLFIKSVLH